MHVIEIKDLQQHAEVMGVLIKVGGTFQGHGSAENPRIIVNDAQYKALIKARVVNGARAKKRGKKKTER